MIKKILFFLACMLPLTVFAQEIKVGYYNRVDIIKTMPEYTAATTQLDKLRNDIENEIALIKQEYNKKYTELVSGRDTMPEAIRVRRESELQDLQTRIQSFISDSGVNYEKKQTDLFQAIAKKMDEAIQVVGKNSNFLLIFDTSAKADLSYFSVDKCVDVTSLVRSKLGLK